MIPILLFGLPWSVTVAVGTRWPTPVFVIGTVAFAAGMVTLPAMLVLGHRRAGSSRGKDAAARVGDFLLGSSWVLFSWSVLGELLRGSLIVAGVADPARSRIVALAVLGVSMVLLVYGVAEAMRVPRIKRLDVRLPGLGAGLDGLRVVVLTDTHFGPINRTRWSARVVRAVNELDADVVCHAGDLADGSVDRRRAQVAPLAQVRARFGRFYVTGNHEYFGEAQAWLNHMAELGWQPLHNQSRTLTRDGAGLVVAGVDDATASASGAPGHGADLGAALAGVDRELPVLLLAHQPAQIGEAVRAGVALQVSGHTHGGQIWPFHYLVRLQQPVVSGLSRHGEHTQLYTSRGTGFWGPPLRVFAPGEISVLTLHG